MVCDSHLIIDEKNPFLLYCLKVDSGYSKYVVKKKKDNFNQLQRQLLNLRNQTVLQQSNEGFYARPLEQALPRLPTSILEQIFSKKCTKLTQAQLSTKI